MDLLAPLQTAADDLATIWRQQRHPVFNAVGNVVGSYDTLDALCQGQWFVDRGQVQPPASQLYVVDFWGRRVPLSTQCTRSAVANAGGGGSVVFPQPVQPGSAIQAQAAANEAATGSPAEISPGDLVGPTLDQSTVQQYETWALWGAIGLLGVALLTSGRSGRR